jgi:hypothetical protein
MMAELAKSEVFLFLANVSLVSVDSLASFGTKAKRRFSVAIVESDSYDGRVGEI